jgi:hypothetical protein
MRKRTFVVLLLLAAFSLGFVAGPHPCTAEQGERESPSSSCHEASGSSEGPAVRGSVPPHDDGESCCDAVCPHACHMPAAAAGVKPTAFVVEPVSQVVVQVSAPALSPLAHPIDHVPLA